MNKAIKTVPFAQKEIKLTPSDRVRFWSKINKDGPTVPHMKSPCWVWTAAKSKGYGHIRIDGRVLISSRVMWIIQNGSMGGNDCICHRCDNPSCVNPMHLFIGTHKDNAIDRENKGRGNQPRGDKHGSRTKPGRRPRGNTHWARSRPDRLPRGEANGSAKLTESVVNCIRTSYTTGGVTHKLLAVQFGVNRSTIGKIMRHEIWSAQSSALAKLQPFIE